MGGFFDKIPFVRALRKLTGSDKKKHEDRGESSHGHSHGSGKKLKPGHKYGRLQKFETLSHDQKKLLHSFMKQQKPHKVHKPEMFRQAQQLLGQGAMQGPPISPMEAQGQGFLQNLLQRSPEQQYENFAAPYMRQFQEETVPQLAERFAGVGALSGSGFQNALGQAGAGLSENLAALKGNLINQMLGQQTQAANVGLGYAQLPAQRFGQQMNVAQSALGASMIPQEMRTQNRQFNDQMNFNRAQQVLGTPPFGYLNIPPEPRQPGLVRSMLPGLAGGAASGIGSGIGAVVGGALGTAIMPGIGTTVGTTVGTAAGAGIAGAAGGMINRGAGGQPQI